MNDLKLMETKTFSERLVELKQPLFKFALSLTRRVDKANDLLQETYLRALSFEDKFIEGSNIKAWAFTVMKRLFINDWRKRQKSAIFNDITDNNYFIESTTSGKPLRPDEEYSIEEITKEINNLSDTFRDVFNMFIFGYKYKEIADILDMNIGTVKSRIFFAKKELREKLKDFKYGN